MGPESGFPDEFRMEAATRYAAIRNFLPIMGVPQGETEGETLQALKAEEAALLEQGT